jgi:4-hydroxybenzoate polyprenyltransferase
MDLAFIARRLDAYERLIRLDKPIGTLLLLWPTLWAVWLASGGWPRFDILLIFVVGTLLMRSAGCAMNDYADRDFDRHVERTMRRLSSPACSPARHSCWFCSSTGSRSCSPSSRSRSR